MKKIKRTGIQHKLFLCFLGLLSLSTTFHMVVAMSQLLKQLQESSASTQLLRESMQQYAIDVMEDTIAYTLTEHTNLEADVTNRFFLNLATETMLLDSGVIRIFENRDKYLPVPIEVYEDKSFVVQEGEPFIFNANDVDLYDPEIAEEAGLVGNCGDLLEDLCYADPDISGCFFASDKGYILVADNDPQPEFDDNGKIAKVPIQKCDWYIKPGMNEELYLMKIRNDPYFGEDGLVACCPVFADGKRRGIVGIVMPTETILSLKRETSFDTESCIVDQAGHIVYSEAESGIFKKPDEEEDIREKVAPNVAGVINKALQGESGLEPVIIDEKEYFLSYAYLESVSWCRLQLLDRDISTLTVELMMSAFDELAGEFSSSAWSEGTESLIFSGIMAGAILVLGVILASLYGKRLVKPLETMTKVITELKVGDETFEMRPEYRTEDEVELLAEAFTSLTARTKLYIREITEYTAERERIDTELTVARQMQANMLPKTFPAFPDRDDFDVYASMTPAKEVGGDFYDYFLIDEDKLAIVIADVSGKGVPAALFMMVARNVLRTYLMMMTDRTPSQVLKYCNKRLYEQNKEELFVTLWLGILDVRTGIITASSAGHTKPVFSEDGEHFEIYKDKHGLVLGGSLKAGYQDYEIQMSRGSIIFLYTDGLVEAINKDEELFGNNRMLESLNNGNHNELKELLTGVKQDVDQFVGTEVEPFDDLTMLVVRYNGKEDI